MSSLALITGAGSGIGRALAEHLIAHDYRILAIGRRDGPLQALAERHPGQVDTLALDIASESAPQHIASVTADQDLRLLVHNAGTLEPAGPLSKVSREAFVNLLQTNLTAPLFITQTLLPQLKPGARVLHVSSGAAHRPLSGWGPYCVSKSALHMLYQCWREELAGTGVLMGSARPGVVDTPMQKTIRQLSPSDFPAVEHFRRLKQDDELTPPTVVARFLGWLLLEADDDTFSREENDIRDDALVRQWY